MNTCWAKYALLIVVMVLGSLSMLSACGKKGNLTLPDAQNQSQKLKN